MGADDDVFAEETGARQVTRQELLRRGAGVGSGAIVDQKIICAILQVDGASAFATFRRLTLPLLAPAITIAAVFRAIDAFRSFDLVYGLTYGGPARATTTLGFFAYQQAFEFQNYSYSAAVAYMMVIVLIVASTVIFRFARPRRVEAL